MDGSQIKVWRMKYGMSLSDLASQSGVSKSYLSLIERGKQKNPSIDVLIRIASALHTDINHLLGQERGSSPKLDEKVIELARKIEQAKVDSEQLQALIEIIAPKEKPPH